MANPDRKGASCARGKNAAGKSPSERRLTPELQQLLSAPETRLLMQADNVGLAELIAALTRIPIPRRKRASKNAA